MLENRGLEIIILAVVVLLLFGAKRLPDSARALGKSLRILKTEVGAMKTDEPTGTAPGSTAPGSTATGSTAPARTIQAAPGLSDDARPLTEPQQRTGTPA